MHHDIARPFVGCMVTLGLFGGGRGGGILDANLAIGGLDRGRDSRGIQLDGVMPRVPPRGGGNQRGNNDGRSGCREKGR